jgi:YD repeat-containing protein
MIGKLVGASVAGAKAGKAVGSILRDCEKIECATGGSLCTMKGILRSVVNLLRGGDGSSASGGDGGAASDGSGGGTACGGSSSGTTGGNGPASITGAAVSGAKEGSSTGAMLRGGEHIGSPFTIDPGALKGPLHSAAKIIPPHVGGVLFNKSADVLTDLEEITGAYWDANLGQLVLTGKKNGRGRELDLPPMDADHLAVAMRTVFSNDNLGVSIDPPPGYVDSGAFPPEGTKMQVKYLGNTANTLFGAIMFEADRLLKTLSIGKDNNDVSVEVTSRVPGYQKELELAMSSGSQIQKAWSRMWFLIDDMRLELSAKESSDRHALRFGKATLKVKAQYVSKEKNPGVDPNAERFASHFTVHFDEFAEEFPVLERLRELAKIVAVVKWLRDSGKPVDLSFLRDYQIIPVPTPKRTPGISASKSKQWPEGRITHSQVFSIYGGVDFDFKYQATIDDPWVRTLVREAYTAKPIDSVQNWDFPLQNTTQRALAFRFNKSFEGCVTLLSDLSYRSNDGVSLGLFRKYDSANSRSTVFGYGWDLHVPYSILILNHQKEDSPLLIIDNVNNKSSRYVFVEQKQSYFCVTQEKKESAGFSFSYNPTNSINKNSDGTFAFFAPDGSTYLFDTKGRLISQVSTDNRAISYKYEENRLVEISDTSGRNIRLAYDEYDRIKCAIGSEKKVVRYYYDPSGDLVRISDGEGRVFRYGYDVFHRLTQIKDAKGNLTFQQNYDSLGRPVTKMQDTVVDERGVKRRRHYDQKNHLYKEEDSNGNTISYSRENGCLSRTTLLDNSGQTMVFEHDEEERIVAILNPLGQKTNITYDVSGNITSLRDANGHIRSLEYDADGRLISLTDPMGNRWTRELDAKGRLVKIIDPAGFSLRMTYEGEWLATIENDEGITKYEYDDDGRVVKIEDANGNVTKYEYDVSGKLIKVKDALGNVTQCS